MLFSDIFKYLYPYGVDFETHAAPKLPPCTLSYYVKLLADHPVLSFIQVLISQSRYALRNDIYIYMHCRSAVNTRRLAGKIILKQN